MSTAEMQASCVRYFDRALSRNRHLLPRNPCAKEVVARLGGAEKIRELWRAYRPENATPPMRWPSPEEVRAECFANAAPGSRVDKPADMAPEAFHNAGKTLVARRYLAYIPGTQHAFMRTEKVDMPPAYEKRRRRAKYERRPKA
jgi:hypothetical protein